jgi:hypothetical protein
VRERVAFDYAVFRVVPRVEREEFLNAGVVVYCRQKRFLEVKIHLNAQRLLALFPQADVALLSQHLDAIRAVADGVDGAGAIAALPQRDRFGWLVAPRSTMIQVSAVHTGLCEDPACALQKLFDQMVEV